MRFSLTLILISIVVNSGAQTGVTQLGLKGKVKSLQTQETYRYKKNGVAFTPWEKTYAKHYQFDKTGMYTEYEEKKSDGTGGYRIKYTNKPKEKKIEQAFYDKEGKPTISKTSILDNNGRVLELIEYTREGHPDRTYTYTYDNKGNNITMTGQKADGKVTSKYTWNYNEKNQKTDLLLETPGYANSYQNWKYDAKGNPVEESWLNGKKEVTYRFERSYDEKGNKIEEIKYKNGTQLLSKTTWKYDYDKQGNWIKRTEYTSAGEDYHTEERTFVYY